MSKGANTCVYGGGLRLGRYLLCVALCAGLWHLHSGAGRWGRAGCWLARLFFYAHHPFGCGTLVG
jgi:hypothetical protein